MALKYPLSYPLRRTPRRVRTILMSIWLVMSFTFGAFIMATQQIYGQKRDAFSCEVYYLSEKGFIAFICIFALWGPVLGTCFVYMLVFRIASKAGSLKVKPKRKPTQEDQEFSTTKADSSGAENSVNEGTSMSTSSDPHLRRNSKTPTLQRGMSREDREKRALRTISLLLLTYAVCWLPLSFVFLLAMIDPKLIENPLCILISYWMGYLNSTLNPACYAVGHPLFRENLKRLCCKLTSHRDSRHFSSTGNEQKHRSVNSFIYNGHRVVHFSDNAKIPKLEEIKKLVENSKKELDSKYDNFVNSIQSDLTSFKKKTLDSI